MAQLHPSDPTYGNKFGFCEAVGTAFETVWIGGGLYPWRTTGAPLFMASTVGADVGQVYRTAGIRAFDYATPFEGYTVDPALNGQTPVPLDAGEMLTVDRSRLQAGFTAATGIVSIFAGTATAGVPDSAALTLAIIAAGEGTSQQCVLSCPAGASIGLTSYGAGSSGFIQWLPAWRSPNAAGTYGSFIVGPAGEQDNITTRYNFPVPDVFGSAAPDGTLDLNSYLGPGSQIELRAKTDVSTKRVVGTISWRVLSLPE